MRAKLENKMKEIGEMKNTHMKWGTLHEVIYDLETNVIFAIESFKT